LSVCYGIVHEHGGDINAFNLHPEGAAVVVELRGPDFAEEDLKVWPGTRADSVSV
jgi:K+-sensing histidine kinase KdpD